MIKIFGPVLAQIYNPAHGTGTLTNTTSEFMGRLLRSLIGIGLVGGAIIFLFVFATGAIGWVTAGGDKNQLQSARTKINYALIGLFVLLVFFAVVDVISCILGTNLMSIQVGALNIEFIGSPVCP